MGLSINNRVSIISTIFARNHCCISHKEPEEEIFLIFSLSFLKSLGSRWAIEEISHLSECGPDHECKTKKSSVNFGNVCSENSFNSERGY